MHKFNSRNGLLLHTITPTRSHPHSINVHSGTIKWIDLLSLNILTLKIQAFISKAMYQYVILYRYSYTRWDRVWVFVIIAFLEFKWVHLWIGFPQREKNQFWIPILSDLGVVPVFERDKPYAEPSDASWIISKSGEVITRAFSLLRLGVDGYSGKSWSNDTSRVRCDRGVDVAGVFSVSKKMSHKISTPKMLKCILYMAPSFHWVFSETQYKVGAIYVNIVWWISRDSTAEVVFLAVPSLDITDVCLPDVIIELSLLTFDIFESWVFWSFNSFEYSDIFFVELVSENKSSFVDHLSSSFRNGLHDKSDADKLIIGMAGSRITGAWSGDGWIGFW